MPDLNFMTIFRRFSSSNYTQKINGILDLKVLLVNSDPTTSDSDSDGYTDDIDVDCERFEYINGLKKLCDIAVEYKPDDFFQSQLLVLQVIRYDCYSGSFWDLTAGNIDGNFVEYLNCYYPKVYSAFISGVRGQHITINDPITYRLKKDTQNTDLEIDISHWAAVLNALYYDSISDAVIDDSAGWLGDYYSMILDLDDKGSLSYENIYNEIGRKNGYFETPDVFADFDAENMYYNNKNMICSISTMFNSYFKYTNTESKRYGTFVYTVTKINNRTIHCIYDCDKYPSIAMDYVKSCFRNFVQESLNPFLYVPFNSLILKSQNKLDKYKICIILKSSVYLKQTTNAFTDHIFDHITDVKDVIYV